jgi:hypothetical protein
MTEDQDETAEERELAADASSGLVDRRRCST